MSEDQLQISDEGQSRARFSLPYGWGWKFSIGLLAAVFVVFLLVPIVALLTTLGPSELKAGISHPIVWPALKLSAYTTSISLAIIVLFGTPLAWLLRRRSGTGIRFLETLVRLPAVLPPAVAGVALLLAFGRMGLVGSYFAEWGWSVPFSRSAVIMAEVFVAAPFYLQAAISAFRRIDPAQLAVARTLGASPSRVFFQVALPAARAGLIAGAAMAWARALGEFGATLMFAGNFAGETQTLTLAVYTAFESNMQAAQAISLLLVTVAFTVLFTLSRSQSSTDSSSHAAH